jgi:hypothetical protein
VFVDFLSKIIQSNTKHVLGVPAYSAGGLFVAICNFEVSQLQDFRFKQGSLNTNTK